MDPAPRAARYSGRDRPAWRMNHTGVCGTATRRQAAMRGGCTTRSYAPARRLADPPPHGDHVTLERDIEEEQALLDQAYDGLDAMRAEATRMLQSVLDLGRGGTFQSRTERDIVVRTSLARLAQLDIGDQALTFGRIDRQDGESYHIGRLAVSGPDHEPLVV